MLIMLHMTFYLCLTTLRRSVPYHVPFYRCRDCLEGKVDLPAVLKLLVPGPNV